MLAQIQPRVASGELRAALAEVFTTWSGAPRRVVELLRRKSRYSSSCVVENLVAGLDSGERLRLVFKDTSPGAIAAFGHSVRPKLFSDPAREIEVYHRILYPGLGTPLCYGAVCLPDFQRNWLFLGRVEGVPLWQFGSLAFWQDAARWLARLHTEFTARPDRIVHCQHLLHYDRQYLSRWIDRAEKLLRKGAVSTSADALRAFGRLASRYDRVCDRLASIPVTLMHGEFYPSNILIRARSAAGRVCPIDWETAGVGPGVLDLAALTSGNWSDHAKTSMIGAYHAAFEPANSPKPSLTELQELIDYGLLQICVQWLGWADSWSPPPEHAQDWFHQSLRLAAKLKIV